MADCPCTFPETPSIKCALEIAQMVMDGTLLDRKGEALKHAGCVLGSIGEYLTEEGPIFAKVPFRELPRVESAEQAAHLCVMGVEGFGSGNPKGLNPILIYIIQKLIEFVLGRLV